MVVRPACGAQLAIDRGPAHSTSVLRNPAPSDVGTLPVSWTGTGTGRHGNRTVQSRRACWAPLRGSTVHRTVTARGRDESVSIGEGNRMGEVLGGETWLSTEPFDRDAESQWYRYPSSYRRGAILTRTTKNSRKYPLGFKSESGGVPGHSRTVGEGVPGHGLLAFPVLDSRLAEPRGIPRTEARKSVQFRESRPGVSSPHRWGSRANGR